MVVESVSSSGRQPEPGRSRAEAAFLEFLA